MQRYGIGRSCILVLPVRIVPLSTIFVLILELFRKCGFFLFLFNTTVYATVNVYFSFRFNQYYVKL